MGFMKHTCKTEEDDEDWWLFSEEWMLEVDFCRCDWAKLLSSGMERGAGDEERDEGKLLLVKIVCW